ncbi:MAG: hypothetical protein PHE58_01805 [Candidatus Omnitrophica bacterium]|nr:hypothetical protein [Candidatus Omnitrophota bacterium]
MIKHILVSVFIAVFISCGFFSGWCGESASVFETDTPGLAVELILEGPSGDKPLRNENIFEFKITFKNTSSESYWVYYSPVYAAQYFVVRLDDGRIIRPKITAHYDYITGKNDFHEVKPGAVFFVNITGRVVEYAKHWFRKDEKAARRIAFDDMEIYTGKGRNCRVYLVYEQDSRIEKIAGTFGIKKLWVGKSVSNPLDLVLE